MNSHPLHYSLEPRSAIQSLGASRIREVANAGMGRKDVLPFWFGEPDEVTPETIRLAAKNSIDLGETFYAHNLGIELISSKKIAPGYNPFPYDLSIQILHKCSLFHKERFEEIVAYIN